MAFILTEILDPTNSNAQGSIAERLTALKGYLEEMAITHDTGFAGQVVDFLSEDVTNRSTKGRKKRKDVMGDPERYIEVFESTPADGSAFNGRPGFRFDVFVYYGQDKGVTRETHADAWRDLLYTVSSTTPGLLYGLANQKVLVGVTSHEYDMLLESVQIISLGYVDRGNNDWMGFCYCVVNLA